MIIGRRAQQLTLVGGMLLPIVLPSSVLAQGASTGFVLEEVTITATKSETNLQDTPMTLTALDGEAIQQAGRSSLTQILQDVAGVQSNSAGQSGQYFWVRGIGSSPTFGQDTAVTTSINGVFQQMSQATRAAFFDIGRVEVARGPQSTLTGRNSLGGAINIITAEPEHDFHAEGTLGLGSYDLMNSQGMLNAPLGDSVAIRGAFSTEKRDGLLTNGTSDSQLQAARVRVLFEPTDTFKVILSGEQSKTSGKGGGAAHTGLFVPSQYSELGLGRYCRNVTECATAVTSTGQLPGTGFNSLPMVTSEYNTFNPGAPASRDYESRTFYLDLNWDMGWAKLFVQPTWMKSDSTDSVRTFDMLQYALWSERVVRLQPSMPVVQQEQIATSLATIPNWTHIRQLQKSAEIRISSPDDSRIKWLGGLFFFENGEQVRTNLTPAGTVGTYTAGVAQSYCLPTAVAGIPTPCTTTSIPAGAVGVVRSVDDADLRGVLTEFRPGVDSKRKSTDIAPYAQVVLPFTDAMNLTLGARYTREKKERFFEDPTILPRRYFVVNCVEGPLANPLTCTNGTGTGSVQNQYPNLAQTKTWNIFDYRATLDYKFTPDNMVYVSISTGFRGGNFQNVGTANASFSSNTVTPLATPVAPRPGFTNSYDPERLTAYEIGTRNDLFDNRLRLNASIYYYDYQDYQYGYQALVWPDQDPDSPFTYTTNAGKAKTFGVDFESSFLLTPSDQFTLNAAYIKSELGQLTLPGGTSAAIADANSLQGQPLRRAPKWSGGPRYSHRFDMGDHGSLTASADLHYESSSYVNNVAPASLNNTNRFIQQPAYTRSNLSLSYATSDGKFNISAFARNLEDEITIGGVTTPSFTAANNNQLQNLSWDPSEGRTYGVTLSVKL